MELIIIELTETYDVAVETVETTAEALRGGETIVLGGAPVEVCSAFPSFDHPGLISLSIAQKGHPLGFVTMYLIPDEPILVVQ